MSTIRLQIVNNFQKTMHLKIKRIKGFLQRLICGLEKLINIGIKKPNFIGNFLSLRDARNDINIGFWFSIHTVDS